MWKALLAVALVFVFEPVAARGPWWRVGMVGVFGFLAFAAWLLGELKDQLKHG